MAINRFTNAQKVREQRDYHGKPMQIFEIDGKKIKTNLGAWQDCMWNGNDVPKKYCYPKGHNGALGFRQSMDEAFEEYLAKGYTEIRFVETSTCVRGYHNVYVWASGREA